MDIGDDVKTFISKCENNEVLRDVCMFDESLMMTAIKDIIMLSRSSNPIELLTGYLSGDNVDVIIKLDQHSTTSVPYLAAIANACLRMDVEQFEDSLLGYTDFLVEESIRQDNPSILDVTSIIQTSLSNQVCQTTLDMKSIAREQIISHDYNKSHTTVTSSTKTTTAIPLAKVKPITATNIHTVKQPVLTNIVPSPVKQSTSTHNISKAAPRRGRPDMVSHKKNKQSELIAIAAKIASVRSIDTSCTTVKFRSVDALKSSEFIKSVLSLKCDIEKRDYVKIIFPRLDNVSIESHEVMIDVMLECSKSSVLRGLSGAILEYEICLKTHMIENDVGYIAKILAIGQKTSVVLDGPTISRDIKHTVKYKRQAILHEDVLIISDDSLASRIATCLKSSKHARYTTGDIIGGFLKDRTHNIIKHLENIKIKDSVDRYNKATTKHSRIFSNMTQYNKRLSAAHIAKLGYVHIRFHHDLVASYLSKHDVLDISDAEIVYNSYDATINALNERRHSMDLWGIETTGRTLYHKQYVEFYRGYLKELDAISTTLNNASIMMSNTIDMHLVILGARTSTIPRIIKPVTKNGAKSHKINTTAIKVKNSKEGKRYVVLKDELIADFSTSVTRNSELMKYNIDGKTNENILQTMSELLFNMSTSRSVDGSELRHLSQLLLACTKRVDQQLY